MSKVAASALAAPDGNDEEQGSLILQPKFHYSVKSIV